MSVGGEPVHKYVFPIVDQMVDIALREVKLGGERISCRKGCSHCCHLLVEISWEEALHLGEWILRQPEEVQSRLKVRLKANTGSAKKLFRRYRSGIPFAGPCKFEKGIPEFLFDKYFYEESRPCPFLENSVCMAYEARPIPCRIHLVSSNPRLCAREAGEAKEYAVPTRIDELRDEVAPVARAVLKDPRNGHLGIMVEAALAHLERRRALSVSNVVPFRRERIAPGGPVMKRPVSVRKR